jgi:hypothetical protein
VTVTTWAVSAAIPIAMLLVYWLVLEPRQDRDRADKRRFRKALEKAIARAYKLEEGHVISPEGLMFEGASDPYRKGRYKDLEIPDLFVPDPRKGHVILNAKADEGAAILAAATKANAEEYGFGPELLVQAREWERLTSEGVAFYHRGPLRKAYAAGFTKHSFTNEPNYGQQLKRLEQEIRELRLWAADQVKLAREQAERGDDF